MAAKFSTSDSARATKGRVVRRLICRLHADRYVVTLENHLLQGMSH